MLWRDWNFYLIVALPSVRHATIAEEIVWALGSLHGIGYGGSPPERQGGTTISVRWIPIAPRRRFPVTTC
jgi:hypothetical protein